MLLQPKRVSSTSVWAITSERSTGLALALKFSMAIEAAEGFAGGFGTLDAFSVSVGPSSMASMGGPKSSSGGSGGTSSGSNWISVSGSMLAISVCKAVDAAAVGSDGLLGDGGIAAEGCAGLTTVSLVGGVGGVGEAIAAGAVLGSLAVESPSSAVERRRAVSRDNG